MTRLCDMSADEQVAFIDAMKRRIADALPKDSGFLFLAWPEGVPNVTPMVGGSPTRKEHVIQWLLSATRGVSGAAEYGKDALEDPNLKKQLGWMLSRAVEMLSPPWDDLTFCVVMSDDDKYRFISTNADTSAESVGL